MVAQNSAVVVCGKQFGGLGAVILQHVDPFSAIFVGRLAGIERGIRAGQPPLHHRHIIKRHAQFHRHSGAQRRAVQRLTIGRSLAHQTRLNPAHVEKQRFLRRRRPCPHHRPVPHHIVLQLRLDPKHRIGGKAYAPLGIELLSRFHQAHRGFLRQVRHRGPVAAELGGHRQREAHVRGNQLVQCRFVTMVTPSACQSALLLCGQKRCGTGLCGQPWVGELVECHAILPRTSAFACGVWL